MAGPKHHACHKGKWIRLKMRDGRTIVGRFDQALRNGLRLTDGREYLWKRVRQWRVLKADQTPRREA